jgi:hypothetical protein
MRPRFTIRSVMIITVLVAMGCGWYAVKRKHLQRRAQAITHLVELSGPVSWYDGGTEFEYLYGIELEGHFIDERLWREISVLTEARKVSLIETNVTDHDFKHLRRFWNIRDLCLYNTRVTSVGVRSIAKLKSLETLIISNTLIDDDTIDSLLQLKNLSTLNVRGTNISTLGIARLRRAMPNCRLYCDDNIFELTGAPKERPPHFDNVEFISGPR